MTTLLRTILVICLSIAAFGPGVAAAPPQLRSLVATHERFRSHLAADDRQLLDALCTRVRSAMPRPARVPEDIRKILASAAPGLSFVELGVLTDYVAGDPMIVADAEPHGPLPLKTVGSARQEMPVSYDLQYLNLQSRMQGENRRYALLENILRTKHDTVKNAIGNIR